MKRVAVGVLLVLAAVSGLFAQTNNLQPLVRVQLDKNNSETILMKELRARVGIFQKQQNVASFTAKEKKEILNSMIDEKLLVQAARKAGMTIPDSTVNQYFLSVVSQSVGKQVTEAEFIQLIKTQYPGMSVDDYMKSQVGMGLSDYKAYLKNQMVVRNYILSVKQSELQAVAPTDKQIRDFYEVHKQQFVMSDTMKVFLVSVPAGENAEAARTKLIDLYNSYKGKKTTVNAVVDGAAKGGYIAGEQFIGKTDQYAQLLGISTDALLALFKNDVGYISAVTEAKNGNTVNNYYFFEIEKKYAQKQLDLSDSCQPEATVTVYEYIKSGLGQQMQMQFLVQAVDDISQKYHTDENVEMLVNDAELDKLLNW